MPLYEYVCQKCGNVLELLQKAGQNQAGQNCPVCNSHDLVKKISTPNIGRETGHRHPDGESCCGNQPSASCPPGGCCGGKK